MLTPFKYIVAKEGREGEGGRGRVDEKHSMSQDKDSTTNSNIMKEQSYPIVM